MDIEAALSRRVKRVGESGIRKMMMMAQHVPGAISLAQGIPDARTPAYIRDGIAELLRENSAIGKYSLSPGIKELRKLVAEIISKKGNFSVDWHKNICITAGAIEALAISIAALVDKGDDVVLFDPGYPPYIEHINLTGATPVYVPLQPENGWKIDKEKLRAAVTGRTKALIVCNPSNPTGMIVEKDDLDEIVALAKQYEFFIIADVTYEFLVYDGKKIPTLLDYPEIRDRLLVCYSFSKEFSMTGWRVGYLYAPEKVLEQALKVHDAYLLCAPTISQYAALIALTKKPNADPEGMHKDLEEKRDLTCARLDRLPDLFSYAKPQGAYYILAHYKKPNISSWDFSTRLLNEAGVVTVPGAACGGGGEGHVRISYGTSKRELNEAFDRIEAWRKHCS